MPSRQIRDQLNMVFSMVVYDGDIADLWTLEDSVFDLTWFYSKAAYLYLLVLTPDKFDIAVKIESRQIAGSIQFRVSVQVVAIARRSLTKLIIDKMSDTSLSQY